MSTTIQEGEDERKIVEVEDENIDEEDEELRLITQEDISKSIIRER